VNIRIYIIKESVVSGFAPLDFIYYYYHHTWSCVTRTAQSKRSTLYIIIYCGCVYAWAWRTVRIGEKKVISPGFWGAFNGQRSDFSDPRREGCVLCARLSCLFELYIIISRIICIQTIHPVSSAYAFSVTTTVICIVILIAYVLCSCYCVMRCIG